MLCQLENRQLSQFEMQRKSCEVHNALSDLGLRRRNCLVRGQRTLQMRREIRKKACLRGQLVMEDRMLGNVTFIAPAKKH